MGRGHSKIASASGPAANASGGAVTEFPEAFAAGKDFQAVNGVNHVSRTVSRTTQGEWDAYTAAFGSDISAADVQALEKEWDPRTGNLYGYIRTTNSMAINKKFYDSPDKGPDELFDKRTEQGQRDLQTIDALDRAIASHKTPTDGTYYRFCAPAGLQRSYGFSDAEMAVIMQAPNMTQAQLAALNQSLQGSKCSSPGYVSTSANRSLNAFSNPSAPQSKGYVIERRMGVKAGTNAFAAKMNAQESEVIFGRNFGVTFSHITVEGNHIVVHENA